LQRVYAEIGNKLDECSSVMCLQPLPQTTQQQQQQHAVRKSYLNGIKCGHTACIYRWPSNLAEAF